MFKLIALLVFCQVTLYKASPTHLTDNLNNQDNPRWTVPLIKLGNKFYYFGTFHKSTWYKAYQYCRFHGLQLATIKSPEENEALTKYLLDLGGQEHYWLSGTDFSSDKKYYWMSTGAAVTYADWWPGQPDNYRSPKDGEIEHCLCLWNPYNTGLRWNDCQCSAPLYFVCEVAQ